MTPRVASHVRTGVTLVVLALLLVYAVNRGLTAATAPLPERADPPVCVESDLEAGDVLRTSGITVSVVNAGRRVGLARTTLDDLSREGFDPGEVANARDRRVQAAQIWSPGGLSPAARLLRSHLRGEVEVVDREGAVAGLVVVVGDRFEGVREGRRKLTVGETSTVCGPAALG